MAKKRTFNFQEVFEEHPIKSCIGCFLIGVTVSYTLICLFYENKIQNITDRYEDKIEFLKKTHEQDLEIREIKLSKEEGTKYFLNIESDSKLGRDLSKLINTDKNEK